MPTPPQAELRPYRVTENRRTADGCFALVLDPVDAARPTPPFKAGQWVGLHLLDPDGSEWAKAAYSIAIAPHENVGGRIELGIKREGDFTARAEALQPGDIVNLQGPFGVFTTNPAAKRWVFFAGGIGIAPIRSMIRERTATQDGGEIVLFYSSRHTEAMPYVEEFRELAVSHPNFHFIEVCTGVCDPDWSGERGRIDAAMLQRHIRDFSIGEYLLCGPKPFMDDIIEQLKAFGVDPKRIKRERFS